MTFTSDDLASLKEALLSGASSVSIQGRTVTFRSISEIKSLIFEIEKSIDAESPSPSTATPNKVKATFCK